MKIESSQIKIESPQSQTRSRITSPLIKIECPSSVNRSMVEIESPNSPNSSMIKIESPNSVNASRGINGLITINGGSRLQYPIYGSVSVSSVPIPPTLPLPIPIPPTLPVPIPPSPNRLTPTSPMSP